MFLKDKKKERDPGLEDDSNTCSYLYRSSFWEFGTYCSLMSFYVKSEQLSIDDSISSNFLQWRKQHLLYGVWNDFCKFCGLSNITSGSI